MEQMEKELLRRLVYEGKKIVYQTSRNGNLCEPLKFVSCMDLRMGIALGGDSYSYSWVIDLSAAPLENFLEELPFTLRSIKHVDF